MDRFLGATRVVWLVLLIGVLSLPLFVFSQVLLSSAN